MSIAERKSRPAKSKPCTPQASLPALGQQDEAEMARALDLWLRWNAAYELMTAGMFDQSQDLLELQMTIDLGNVLRKRALRLTTQLLGE